MDTLTPLVTDGSGRPPSSARPLRPAGPSRAWRPASSGSVSRSLSRSSSVVESASPAQASRSSGRRRSRARPSERTPARPWAPIPGAVGATRRAGTLWNRTGPDGRSPPAGGPELGPSPRGYRRPGPSGHRPRRARPRNARPFATSVAGAVEGVGEPQGKPRRFESVLGVTKTTVAAGTLVRPSAVQRRGYAPLTAARTPPRPSHAIGAPHTGRGSARGWPSRPTGGHAHRQSRLGP
jgi:hypothetical protein